MADNSLGIAQQATQFLQSEYGKHHLARWEKTRDDYRQKAGLDNITAEQSRAYSIKASVYDDEISYFRTAETIVSTPSIVKYLKDKLKQKGDSSV